MADSNATEPLLSLAGRALFSGALYIKMGFSPMRGLTSLRKMLRRKPKPNPNKPHTPGRLVINAKGWANLDKIFSPKAAAPNKTGGFKRASPQSVTKRAESPKSPLSVRSSNSSSNNNNNRPMPKTNKPASASKVVNASSWMPRSYSPKFSKEMLQAAVNKTTAHQKYSPFKNHSAANIRGLGHNNRKRYESLVAADRVEGFPTIPAPWPFPKGFAVKALQSKLGLCLERETQAVKTLSVTKAAHDKLKSNHASLTRNMNTALNAREASQIEHDKLVEQLKACKRREGEMTELLTEAIEYVSRLEAKNKMTRGVVANSGKNTAPNLGRWSRGVVVNSGKSTATLQKWKAAAEKPSRS